MASLIPTAEKPYFSETLDDHFDTFSRDIRVNKRPTEVFADKNANTNLPGYGDSPNIATVTLTPVYADFPAIINYDLKAKEAVMIEAKIRLRKGMCRIKVKKDCRDYIIDGENESIVVDGYSYITMSDDGAQNYVGTIYYYFMLQRTN
jgi:hypothetical protein